MGKKATTTKGRKAIKDLKPKAADVKGGRLKSSVLKKFDTSSSGVISKF